MRRVLVSDGVDKLCLNRSTPLCHVRDALSTQSGEMLSCPCILLWSSLAAKSFPATAVTR